MDVLSIIKQEHRQVGALIDEADGCEPGDERLHELAREISEKLSLHLSIEERLFYGPLRDQAEDSEERVDVFEAYTEHAAAKGLMEMLRSGRKPDERFKAEMQVLGESVKHHVEEEESKVFAVARKLFDDDELEGIGEQWEKAKQRAQRSSTGGRKKAARKKPARKSVARKTAPAGTGTRRKKARR
ncbi:MAG TPA: hemerythrin domain-containing protein [Candidatus Acidoferrales bacterium]|nr:hemerythrin domain-containing protein [Candidatus Acidoferrales bacterium]